MPRFKFILFSIVILFLTGCAADVANRYYLDRKFPAKSSDQVKILYDKPSENFIVIADFQSRGESVEDMQKKAALIGADAVIISLLGGKYSRNEEWAGEDRYSNVYSRITATAIKFE